jgi:hypothetical protein
MTIAFIYNEEIVLYCIMTKLNSILKFWKDKYTPYKKDSKKDIVSRYNKSPNNRYLSDSVCVS